MRSMFVQTPGLRFHCLADGDGGTELPVLLLHGFPQTSHQWRNQIPALAAAGHPTYAIDTRGFGKTDKPRIRMSRAMLADDVNAFCDAIGADQVYLVGHDWGGIIAFKAAIDNPKRFTKLCIMDTVCTMMPAGTPHVVFYKVAPLAEEFLAKHGRDLIDVRMGGGAPASLGEPERNPYYHYPQRAVPRCWSDADLAHYRDSFDEDTRFAAIQYYRYAMPFHRVIADASAPGGERYESLSEQDMADYWRHPTGMAAHPLAKECLDFAPEDRHKRYPNPAMFVFSKQVGSWSMKDGAPLSGSPDRDQFARYFPDLRTRFVDCGHYIPEEAPVETNDLLLRFLAE